MGFIITTIKLVAVDIIGSIIYFPIWWYTKGLKNAAFFAWNNIKSAEKALAVSILLRYLFKPMYGDYSKGGRAISFFVRIIHLFFMLIIMALALVFWIILFCLWLALPPVAILLIIRYAGS